MTRAPRHTHRALLLAVATCAAFAPLAAAQAGTLAACATPTAPVTFPDAALAGAVRTALSLDASATITCEAVSGLGRLQAQDAGITDLTGLESAVNLTRLQVRRNQIADLSPLAGLTRLDYLDLRNNSIVD
ncbi:MAG TPA: leucine-rich repeat domain-containing protein, partial [Trueperaceae bacterium]|nr:leucine-rich repeat domain-containing protein [Trueperaceae bacterium]